jgi:hypothetical protein
MFRSNISPPPSESKSKLGKKRAVKYEASLLIDFLCKETNWKHSQN